MYIYIYIPIYVCVCVRVCVYNHIQSCTIYIERERDKEKEDNRKHGCSDPPRSMGGKTGQPKTWEAGWLKLVINDDTSNLLLVDGFNPYEKH